MRADVSVYTQLDDLPQWARVMVESRDFQIKQMEAQIEQLGALLLEAANKIGGLLIQIEKDAKTIGNMQYVLANIRDEVIPDGLEPEDYARAALEQKT